MPVRFTCRLVTVRTESGRLRTKYGCLMDENVGIIEIHGPEMVIPPDEEMTPDELDQWRFHLVNETGFSFSFGQVMADSPLVEAKRTIEDQIPPGIVSAKLLWAQDKEGKRTLGVHVTNGWNRAIPNFNLATVCKYDASQPVKLGSVPAQMLGGSECMFHPIGHGPILGNDLWPGVNAAKGYALDPMVFDVMKSRVASLSPECYWIAFLTDGFEVDRISGEIVGAFMDQPDSP